MVFQIGCMFFAIATGVLLRREWRRHRKRHPRFPIPGVPLRNVDERFRLDSVERARDGAVSFVSNADNSLLATPSDLETYVLAALAKGTRRLFEFGTCTGRTTYLWGLNSPAEARITTLTLPSDTSPMQLSDAMRRSDIEHAQSESNFQQFVYSDTPEANKIEQLFQDSATLDTSPYREQMELIFVDGGHSYAYVKNDSQKALEMIAPGGLIVWHDYRGKNCRETIGVYQFLNELAQTLPLRWVQGTSLVFYRAPVESSATRIMTGGDSRAA